jgi:Ca-activated chloride channel family protein
MGIMLIFDHPWLLALIFLPLLLSRMLPPYRDTQQAIRAPWFNRIADLLGQSPEASGAVVQKKPLNMIMFWLCWLLVIVALAHPKLLEEPISRTLPSRDLLLLVDLSGSMETEDFTNKQGNTVDRLTAVKEVLDDFLTRREGDRVGLIVFGNAAFVQVPFTQDLEACRLLLEETAVRMAGPRTALGDAIGLGITLFQRSDMDQRVMIALTDGNDTGSKVPPAEAAKIAADNEITIHIVGVGDPAAIGEEKLDDDSLRAIASETGGQYFHAADRAELETIYTELDKIDTRELETQSYRPAISMFHWPLGALMCLSLLFFAFTFINSEIKHGREEHG